MATTKFGIQTLIRSPDIVNAKLPSMVDKMVWASAQFAVSFNGKERFQPSKYLTDYFTDEAVSKHKANLLSPSPS